MRRWLALTVVLAGAFAAPAAAAPAPQCNFDAGNGLCTIALGTTTVSCGVSRTEEPPFVTKRTGCVAGRLVAACTDTTWPPDVGPPDGQDCEVGITGGIVCRLHTDEAGRMVGTPGCGIAKQRRAKRAQRRR